jgi:hypothetical protein
MTKKIVFKNTLPRFFICILLLPFVLAACSKTLKATSTSDGLSPDAINTAAAQTAEARRSQAGSQTPTNPPPPTFDATSIAVTQAAATQQAQVTPSPVITATVTPSATEAAPPTLTPVLPVGQDNSVFTGKETIPDGTDFAPGAKFTKSWQFMNTGQTTWTTAYSLVFVNGDQMGGAESAPLKIEVQAGRVVDVSVELTAPEKTGSYKGNWRLRNASGQSFGDIVYVQIDVVEGGGVAPTTPPTTGKVTNVTLSVDNDAFTGSCPHTLTFGAELTLNGESSVTFILEIGGSITAPATASETTILSEGFVELTFTPEFTASGSGWARLHITAPNDITSNKVEFTLTCET